MTVTRTRVASCEKISHTRGLTGILTLSMKKGFIALVAAIYCAGCLYSLGEEQKTLPKNELIAPARAGDVAKLSAILDHGADIDAKDRFTETALMNAADAGKLETLKELLARGAKIDIVNKNNRSAFFFATFMGHEDTALELLQAGAKFDVPDKDGYTPLMGAAQNGLVVVVNALLERCADVNVTCRWGNAFLLAASSNSAPIVSALIDKKADVNVAGESSSGEQGWTALHFAAQNGNLEMIQALAKAGANLDAVRKGGRTPLIEAAESAWSSQQSLKLVQFLTEAGADLDCADTKGDTALTIAGQKGRTPVVTFLLQHGVKEKTLRVNVSPYPVQQPLPAQKRWVLATTSLLTQLNRDSHELLGGTPVFQRENAHSLLRKWWKINNHREALQALYWLKNEGHRIDYARDNGIDPDRLLGWDYCRYNFVAGKAYVAGYLTEREAWELTFPVAQKLQQTYHSWKEMGESYLLGRRIWNTDDDQSDMQAVFLLLMNPSDPNSPWNTNVWDIPLDRSMAKAARL